MLCDQGRRPLDFKENHRSGCHKIEDILRLSFHTNEDTGVTGFRRKKTTRIRSRASADFENLRVSISHVGNYATATAILELK